jgi:hypothetical protein
MVRRGWRVADSPSCMKIEHLSEGKPYEHLSPEIALLCWCKPRAHYNINRREWMLYRELLQEVITKD